VGPIEDDEAVRPRRARRPGRTHARALGRSDSTAAGRRSLRANSPRVRRCSAFWSTASLSRTLPNVLYLSPKTVGTHIQRIIGKARPRDLRRRLRLLRPRQSPPPPLGWRPLHRRRQAALGDARDRAGALQAGPLPEREGQPARQGSPVGDGDAAVRYVVCHNPAAESTR